MSDKTPTVIIQTGGEGKLSSASKIVKYGVIGGALIGAAYIGYKIWKGFQPPPDTFDPPPVEEHGGIVKYWVHWEEWDNYFKDKAGFIDFCDRILGSDFIRRSRSCYSIHQDNYEHLMGNAVAILANKDLLPECVPDIMEWDWSNIYEGNVKGYKTVDIVGFTKHFDILELFKIYIHSLQELAIQTTMCYAILVNATEVELGNAGYVISRENELVETNYLPPDPIPDLQGVDYYQADLLLDIRQFNYKQEFIDFLEWLLPDARWYWNCHAFDINGVDSYLGNGLQTLAIKDELPLTVHDVEPEPEPVPDPLETCIEACSRYTHRYPYIECVDECNRLYGSGTGTEVPDENVIIYEPSPEEPPSVIIPEPEPVFTIQPIITIPDKLEFLAGDENVIIPVPSPPPPESVIITEPETLIERKKRLLEFL